MLLRAVDGAVRPRQGGRRLENVLLLPGRPERGTALPGCSLCQHGRSLSSWASRVWGWTAGAGAGPRLCPRRKSATRSRRCARKWPRECRPCRWVQRPRAPWPRRCRGGGAGPGRASGSLAVAGAPGEPPSGPAAGPERQALPRCHGAAARAAAAGSQGPPAGRGSQGCAARDLARRWPLHRAGTRVPLGVRPAWVCGRPIPGPPREQFNHVYTVASLIKGFEAVLWPSFSDYKEQPTFPL